MGTVVTLITDFGRDSTYVAQLKGALLAINPRITLMDITHEIRPQDIVSGAWVLRQTVPYFAEGTFHLAVVDPGVGTERSCLAVDWEGRVIVAPDNGVLSFLCDIQPPRRAVRLENRMYFRSDVSSTFHGRDLMGPALAWLTLGVSLEDLGPPAKQLTRLPGDWQPLIRDREILGAVVFVDRFGNLITNIEATRWPKEGSPLVKMGEIELRQISRTYGENQPGDLIALFGSHGYLEIAVVNGNAAERTKLGPGASVSVTW